MSCGVPWKFYHIEPVTSLESTLSFLNLYRITKENYLCNLKWKGKTQNSLFSEAKLALALCRRTLLEGFWSGF